MAHANGYYGDQSYSRFNNNMSPGMLKLETNIIYIFQCAIGLPGFGNPGIGCNIFYFPNDTFYRCMITMIIRNAQKAMCKYPRFKYYPGNGCPRVDLQHYK